MCFNILNFYRVEYYIDAGSEDTSPNHDRLMHTAILNTCHSQPKIIIVYFFILFYFVLAMITFDLISTL